MVRLWNKLPTEVMKSLSLDMVKRCLNVAFEHMGWDDYGSAGLVVAVDNLKVSFNPDDSVIL